jgi:hypothetical protein
MEEENKTDNNPETNLEEKVKRKILVCDSGFEGKAYLIHMLKPKDVDMVILPHDSEKTKEALAALELMAERDNLELINIDSLGDLKKSDILSPDAINRIDEQYRFEQIYGARPTLREFMIHAPPVLIPPDAYFNDGLTKKQSKENALPVRNEQKHSRNKPCPCGSGKKYKHCCGKNK